MFYRFCVGVAPLARVALAEAMKSPRTDASWEVSPEAAAAPALLMKEVFGFRNRPG